MTPTAFSWNTSVLAGNWNTATNWSPNGIPGASDTVTFGGAPTGQVTVSLNGNEAASTVTFSNTAQSYVLAPTNATDTLTIGTSLTDSATSATADVISAKISASGLTGSVSSATTLKLTNINSANASSITGTFTVSNASGVLEAFSTQAGTDALGTANVTLAAGTLKLDPIPSTFSASGVTGRYFNTGFTAANSGTAVNQVDYSGTPAVTRSDANLNFTSLTSSNLPPGISLNASSTNPQNNFAVEWVGGLNILNGGSYTFTDASDDGSQLVIDGTAVITNNSNSTNTGTVTLGAGVHSFEVRYYQGTGGANQVISYSGTDTGNATTVIPGAASLAASGLFQYAAGSTASFANNVTVNASTAATIDLSLGAMDATLGTLTTGAGSTLNVTGSNTGRTVNFGAVTLGGATTFNPTTANVALGAVSDGGGNFAVTKNGAGTLGLNATANNFSGATTVNAGTLALGNAAALGTNGVSVTSGTVLINAAGALGSTINLNAGETLVANTANVLSGAIVNVPAGAFVQGINANALAGATINLNGGSLSLRANATATIGGTVNVNSNSSVIDVNRFGQNTGSTAVTLSVASLSVANGVTTLNITGPNGFSIQGTSPGFNYTLQTAGAFTLPTNNLTINTVNGNFNFGAAITGTTSITKVGIGTLTFSVDSTGWTAGNTLFIQQGTANVATANGAGASGSTVTLQGGTLGLTGSTITYTMAVALDPTISIGTINQGNTTSNVISGALSMAPGQQLALIGSAGIVTLNQNLALSTGSYVFSSTTAALILSGVISGSGTVVKLGAGNVVLANVNNSFTGGVIVNAGILTAVGAAAQSGGNTQNTGLGQSAVTLNAGGTLQVEDAGAGGNAFFNNANVVTVNGSATINANKFSTAGDTPILTTVNVGNYTLTLGAGTATGSAVVINTLNLSGNATINASNANTASGTPAIGVITDGGNGYGITKTGALNLSLTGASTYTGATRVNAAALILGASASVAGSVFVEPGAVLQLGAAANIAGGQSVTVNSSPTALGEIQINYTTGSLPTILTGTPASAATGITSAGLLALNAAYTGAINLNNIGDGTFFLGASANVTYAGTLTVGAGGAYRLGGGGAQLALANGLADSGGPTNLVVGSALANGTSTLTNGTGTVILLANSMYTGTTLVNRSSTLVITTTAAAATAPVGTGAVTVYGTLTAAGANGSFVAFGSPTTNANSSFTFQPGSILSFDSLNAYQGVTAGNNNTRWGTMALIGLNASTLQLLGQNVASSTTTQTVGAVTFNGGSVIAVKRGNASNATKLTVASLTRGPNKGTLTIVTSATSNLGVNGTGAEQLVDTMAGSDAATAVVNVNMGDTNADTMTAPYIVNGTDNTFVSFGQTGKTGFGNTKFSSRALSAITTNTNNDVVNVAAAQTLTANVFPYALSVGAFVISGSFTVQVQSGGSIWNGTATQTSAVSFSFGTGATPAAEALLYVSSASNFAVLQGSLTTSGGLTKFGSGNISLQGMNSGLTGGIVANAASNSATSTIGALSGTLDFNGVALNLTTNQQNITLNGGTLNIRNNASITLTSTLTVNADATINAQNISGSSTGFAEGFNELIINNSTLTLTGANSQSFIFQNSVTTNPSVLLTGNATFNTSTANLAIVGVISDGGMGFGITKAISGNTVTLNTPSNVNIADTYTGTTYVLTGTLAFASNGTGVVATTSNFLVAPSATLNLNAATNVGGSNTVTVYNNNLGLGVLGIGYDGALPTVTASSSGVLGVNTTITNTAINLAAIGNGTFYLGASSGQTGTYSNASLTIGSGNVWRLGGGGGTLNISNNVITGSSAVVIGAALANGTGAVTNGGGTVNFSVTQGYTGTTTLAGVTVTYVNNTTTNSTTVFSQTLTGAVTLLGSSTINAGGSAAFTSNYLLIKGGLNYGGNSLTLQNGVVALDPTAPAATGTGATIVAGGVTLHVSAMNQLSAGNLQLNNGTFVLGKDDGTGVAPSWTQFMAFESGGYGGGPNQWQITGANGGFAAKGAPATIVINNGGNTPYGYVTSQTVFDRDFRLGNDRRGNLTGVAGSQVFYADRPVILAQNTTLDALHNIGVAPTGPGVSGTPGTGVVNKITGNLNGFGVPHFVTFDSEQAPTGRNFTEAAEVVLAGTNTWTGNPGNVQDVNAGAGGLIIDQNVFVRFANNASLPTGNAGAPAFLAAVRDNLNNYGGGYLLTTGDTYAMPAGLSFLFGETLVGSGNSRTSVLGSSSDAGGGGTATLQGATILIANASGVTGGSALVELSPSNTQTLSLLTRDGTLNFGMGVTHITFQLGTTYFYSNSNLYGGDGVLNSLNYGTASAANSFGVADAQAGTGRRPLEKDGVGTLVLNNVQYSFPIAGTAAGTNFAWNVGNSTTLGGTLQLGNPGPIPVVAVNVVAGTLDLNGFSASITTLGMGGGPAGSTSTVTTGAGQLTLGGNVTYSNTNNPGPATINGNLALGATRTFTVNHSTANTTDMTINAMISGTGFGLTLAGGGTLQLNGTNTYSGTTTVQAGTLVAGTNAPSGAAGALGNASSAVLLGNTTGSSSAALLIGGAFTVGRAITVQAGNTGTLTLGGNTASASTFSGNVTVNNTGGVMLTAAVGGSVTFSGVISGANPVTAIGPGTVVLTNTASTYTGVTTVAGGILSISNDRNLGADPASATAGNVVINGGTLQVTASFTLNSNRGIAVGPSSGSGTGTIDVTGTNTFTYGGILANNATGTGSLVKTDTGTLVLSGANTYGGGTTISGGTLLVNNTTGSGTGTGAATVASGATLGGTGTVSGAVIVSSGGTVNPGTATVGILTVGSADFSGGGNLLIRLPAFGSPGTNYSQLNVTGALTLGGTSVITFDLNGLSTTGTANNVVVAGSITGTFFHTFTVNNPNFYSATPAYTATAINVTIAVPPPINLHFKFNYPGNTPPPGYTSVLPTTTYTVLQGYGWQNTTGLFAQDRHAPTPLLQDFIQGPDNTFLVDVPAPGTYVVNLTMGDLINPHGPVDIIANGIDQFGSNPILEIMGQYVTATFSVTITGTQLQLEIKRIGGDPFWAVNAIDIRTAPIGTIMLSASPPTITGDGVSTSTISGTSSLPQGSLVTVSTSLGTITTADADPNYAGIQVMVGAGGAFSFTVQAPLVGGTATITALEVTAAASGTTTLTITPPTSFHFKFNKPGNSAPNGYISVLPTTLFATNSSYGWQSTTGLFGQDRGGPTPLLRDFIQGPDNTFQVALANGSYLVNLTMGDLINPHGPVDVIANGVDVFAGNLILEPSGQYVTPNFVVNVTSGNLLSLEIKRVGGDPFWAVNAIDIVPAASAVGAITLMSSVATLNADGTSTATISGSGAIPGSLITVSASLGTITTADADPNYAGIQVQANGSGNFSFVIRAPNAAGGAVSITANDVTGARTGASSTILQIIPPSTFHFDFDHVYNIQTQTGYVSVLPTNVYSTSAGYGWNAAVASQYRSSNPFLGTPGLENLQRDIHIAQDAVFMVLVHVTGVNHFSVTVYLGDNDHPHNAHVVIGGSAGTMDEGVVATGVDDPMNPMGGFAIVTYSIPASDFTPDGNGNDVLIIHLSGMATATDPGDNFFNANGVDVVASTTPSGSPAAGGNGPKASVVSVGVAPAVAAPSTFAALSASAGSPTNGTGAPTGAAGTAQYASTAAPSLPAVTPVFSGAGGTQAEFDAALAQSLAPADQSIFSTAGWSLLGQALPPQGRARTGASAVASAGGQAAGAHPEANGRSAAAPEAGSAGRPLARQWIHPTPAAQGWDRDRLDMLDRIFTDMAPTE